MIVFVSEENERESKEISSDIKSILDSDTTKSRTVFEEFTDERILVSYDAFGTKQMKIKDKDFDLNNNDLSVFSYEKSTFILLHWIICYWYIWTNLTTDWINKYFDKISNIRSCR